MNIETADSKRRFSDRVANYVRYRPGYPPAVLETLVAEAGLSPESVVADIGSGPGISAEPFLKFGATVFCVEPNEPMRQASEERLRVYPRFHSVAGTAEQTTLPAESVDFIVAAQAFHWFDTRQSRREFARILRPVGCLVLLWNSWDPNGSAFLRDYEDLLLRFGIDYQQVDHRNVSDETIRSMFTPESFCERRFVNTQLFDYSGLEGRLLSSSYVPMLGHPSYAPMLAELKRIFDTHNSAGQLQFDYKTSLYFGQIAGD